jgi:hypothetical protein
MGESAGGTHGHRVTGSPGKPEVEKVSADDSGHSGNQEPIVVLVPDLLGQQEGKSCPEKQEGENPLVMFAVAMVETEYPHCKSQGNHAVFKDIIIQYIRPENGKTGQY